MSATVLAANLAWAAANEVCAARFARALRDPAEAQSRWLRRQLARDAGSMFGQEHDFAGLRDYRDFARKVPVRTWEDFAPWIARLRGGEAQVLGSARVTHLAPTSGSSGARKLIPFSADLQRGFSQAVGAWVSDLARLRPRILGGPAYWSITPFAADESGRDSAVPVGFADDAEYLGGVAAWLARSILAVPAELARERDPDEFWRRTLTALLECRELRLMSIWHPSFLDLLLSAARREWDVVLSRMRCRGRVEELEKLGSEAPELWWPRLQVISCWGDQAAEAGCRELARRFPRALVQAKGLLATEAAVTIPWRGARPLAVTSHFFEFIDEADGVRLAQELEVGMRYEVVVTNGGGLWRYRLGDVVECTGRIAATPTLRFLGRAGNVSDLRGEKLSEAFVAEVLRGLWPEGSRPAFAELRAEDGTLGGARYALWVDVELAADWGGRLDRALQANPHYAQARRLGQLEAVRVCRADAGEIAAASRRKELRLGDTKPRTLVRCTPGRPDFVQVRPQARDASPSLK